MRFWQLDWDLEFPETTDWDEGARPCLEAFLRLHTPYSAPLPDVEKPTDEQWQLALTRRGEPVYTDREFRVLLQDLQFYGYGWISAEAVQLRLEAMKRDWSPFCGPSL